MDQSKPIRFKTIMQNTTLGAFIKESTEKEQTEE